MNQNMIKKIGVPALIIIPLVAFLAVGQVFLLKKFENIGFEKGKQEGGKPSEVIQLQALPFQESAGKYVSNVSIRITDPVGNPKPGLPLKLIPETNRQADVSVNPQQGNKTDQDGKAEFQIYSKDPSLKALKVAFDKYKERIGVFSLDFPAPPVKIIKPTLWATRVDHAARLILNGEPLQENDRVPLLEETSKLICTVQPPEPAKLTVNAASSVRLLIGGRPVEEEVILFPGKTYQLNATAQPATVKVNKDSSVDFFFNEKLIEGNQFQLSPGQIDQVTVRGKTPPPARVKVQRDSSVEIFIDEQPFKEDEFSIPIGKTPLLSVRTPRKPPIVSIQVHVQGIDKAGAKTLPDATVLINGTRVEGANKDGIFQTNVEDSLSSVQIRVEKKGYETPQGRSVYEDTLQIPPNVQNYFVSVTLFPMLFFVELPPDWEIPQKPGIGFVAKRSAQDKEGVQGRLDGGRVIFPYADFLVAGRSVWVEMRQSGTVLRGRGLEVRRYLRIQP